MKIFDIHSHILPGVDDGSRSETISRRMLEHARDEGIRRILLTPHFHIGRIEQDPEALRQTYDELNSKLEQWGIKVRIYLGNELYYHHDLPSLLEEGRCFTLAGSDYILVEFHPMDEWSRIRSGLQRLQSSGYQVILAHVERYRALRDKPERCAELHEMGILLQANSKAIMGIHGLGVKRFLRKLLKEELIDFVGTDAHDMDKRIPDMRKCADYLEKKYGEAYAQAILWDNAKCVIKNKPI